MILDEELKVLEIAKKMCGSNDIAIILKTADQIRGYLKAIADRPVEPSMDFLERCSIQHPTRGVLPFTPYPFHNRVFDFYGSDARLSVPVISSAMGLSTLLSFYALYVAIHKPDQAIFLLGSRYRMALDMIERIKIAMTSGRLLLPSIRENHKGSITFDNGSRIMARTCNENALRGFSATLVLVDDAANISYSTFDKFWQSSAFLMSHGARFIIQSKPRFAEGPFYRLYSEAPSNGAKTISVPYSDHPERDRHWAENMKAQIGERDFRSQYCCEFIDIPT